MSTMTMTMAGAPAVSSPLASSVRPPRSNDTSPFAPRPMPKRQGSFPTSKPLRPFASIHNTLNAPAKGTGKPIKLIEPPKNHKCTFVLNLSQAEFSRQD